MASSSTRTAQLDYYAEPGSFTDLGALAARVDDLPRDIAALAGIVHGLLIHRFWARAYHVEISDERAAEQGLHGAAAMLRRAIELDPSPLTTARAPGRRVVGICRHFATLLCALLRHQDVPARARCGFASYFEPGKFVDHWVCEYWREDEERWVMVDVQLDALQRAVVKPDFDPLDVPRERFWVAGHAWQRCRAGEADPSTFGIADMWGQWYIRSNLMLDVASLGKIELLPWEPFGLAKKDDLREDDAALIDRVADLSSRGDAASIDELRTLCDYTSDLRVPDDLLARVLVADATGGTGGNPLSSA